jgi:hypothetical protein
MKISRQYFISLAALILIWPVALFAQSQLRVEGQLTMVLDGQSIFEIDGSRNLKGSIIIAPRSGREIEISFAKSARADSKAQAERFLDLIGLIIKAENDERVVLSILTPSDSPWEGSDYGVSLELIVQLPEKMRIEGDLRFMSVNIRGPFGGVSLETSYSPITVAGIRGPVDITTSYSPLSLTEIEGSIKARTRYGSIEASDIVVSLGSALFNTINGAISLSDIQGPVEAYTSYSAIQANDIEAAEGSIVFRTSYSPIAIEDVSGELICETSFSPISMSGVALTHGQSKVETSYSPIDAEIERMESGQLLIYNNYNNINLLLPSDISSHLIASVDAGGRIHAANLPVKPIYLDITRLEGTLGDGLSRIELKVSGVGTIEIEGQ